MAQQTFTDEIGAGAMAKAFRGRLPLMVAAHGRAVLSRVSISFDAARTDRNPNVGAIINGRGNTLLRAGFAPLKSCRTLCRCARKHPEFEERLMVRRQ